MGKQKKVSSKGKKGQSKKVNLVKDERFKVLVGLFIVSFSVYSLFGFISYLFTWKTDQSKLDINLIELMSDASITVDNWAGKLGALIAHTFIHNWFGLASIGFIFIIGLLGFRLFNFRILPFRKTLKYVLLITIWLSLALGFLFHNAEFMPGGAHGFFLSEWLNAFVGKIGTLFIILISLFGLLAYVIKDFLGKVKSFSKSVIKPSHNTLEEGVEDDVEEQTEQELGKQVEEEVPETILKPVEEEQTVEFSDDVVFNEKNFNVNISQVDSTTEKNEAIELSVAPDEKVDTNEATAFNPMDNIETVEIKVAKNEVEEEASSLQNTEEIVEKKDNAPEGVDFAVEIAENEEKIGVIDDKPLGDYDPTLDLSNYKLPPIEMLDAHDEGNVTVSSAELNSNKDRIVETLSHYKIEIVDIKAIVGPTITLYEIVPAPGVRLAKIKNLEDDIALSLAALGIRIIAPIPGKKAVGIEVPNLKPKVVSMKSIIASSKFQESKYELPLALGKTISNETFVIDLAKAPHVLMAGATGQGKSVGLNAILTSLLYKKHPAQLKMVLVDPKKVELNIYSKIEKYFLAKLPEEEDAIITDTQKVVTTLNSLCVEMDSRYDLLKAAHARNLKEYNAKFISRKLNPNNGHKFLPYIVVVIDEFADLIMTAGKEVELPIARLAQLARAIGIHLIIATQRPTTNIITGLIKANFPVRVAFRVTSMMDSRTILDSPGANQLIGRGDMLVSQGSDVVRLQCAFVDTPEVERIVDFIGEQQSYPSAFALPEYVSEDSTDGPSVDLTKRDALFEDAAKIIVANQQGSTSLVQRKFSIGYNRAGRIIDQLEAAGIVGPFEGSKARKVFVPDEFSLEQLIKSLDRR